MCGIAGVFRSSTDLDLYAAIHVMADQLRHRGPDADGFWLDQEKGVALGHRRLSILDLTPAGAQPMVSRCGRFVLIFNGEIYNHLELRQKLNDSTIEWKGHSDTETLLQCISSWGLSKTLECTVGMFALAVWDKRDAKLQLARDRLGEKPLYYGQIAGGFSFASELKALKAQPGFKQVIDRRALALYFQYAQIPAPYSIYQNIAKLEPGHMLHVSLDPVSGFKCTKERYWSPGAVARYGAALAFRDEAAAIDELEQCLKQAVRGQMMSDVPLGAFLSGGVDSSTIVALMQAQCERPVRTFTIGFEHQNYDESSHAEAVARHLQTEHQTFHLKATDATEVIPNLALIYDEPFADSSQIPTYLVSQAARREVTVSLSGDGGDELFGGYNRYLWGRKVGRSFALLPGALRQYLGKAIIGIPPAAWDCLASFRPGKPWINRLGDKAHKVGNRLQLMRTSDDLYRALITEWPVEAGLMPGVRPYAAPFEQACELAGIGSLEERMMLQDMLMYLPDDILVKTDRAAMNVSLETRVPLLDHRVVAMAWRLPLHMKIRNGQGKWALRQVLYRYVPKHLIERPKTGFAMPVAEWLRGPLHSWAEKLLDEKRLREEGFLNPEPVRTVWQQHLSGRHDWTARLWSVLMFQAWLEAQGPAVELG